MKSPFVVPMLYLRICIFNWIRNPVPMASVKIVLRKKKNKQGLYPIAIRVIKDRKTSYVYTGKYINISQWDEENLRVRKSHPNSARLNNSIIKKLLEIDDTLLKLESSDEVVTAQIVKKVAKGNIQPTTFFELAQIYLDDLKKADKYNRHSSDKPRINHFRRFLKKRDINFVEITVPILKRFQLYLKRERKISERSIINNLVVLRTIFNIAIRDGVVDSKYYPFGKGKITIKFPESLKLGLSKGEVIKLESLTYEIGSMKWHSLNVWLLSFYFAGMRVSDILTLKWSDFDDGRLHYTMGKNTKSVSLKVPYKAHEILKQYEDQKSVNNGLVFSEFRCIDLENAKEVFRVRKSANKKLNEYLREVAEEIELGKPLTMHIARHTFGNISGDKIPVQMLQKLYRHSSITTTINYQMNFIYKDADEALDSVVDF